ncbi:Glycosyl transferase group 1 [Hyella patelloides LEGE 07179]|uniref:Glycosyl transferase group 1 n=1 Tax=Hyella patelloides LEGE 07179 TaxID=945734 RepID=A0A563VLC2_9CYAN|nr:glycosyltransferase [Hyella patelloides]VEP12250.1 Glycosyl transferase group 1 [Hyella patelloides LEGE 07179]
MNKNIGLLFSNYGPYHIARLESLSNYLSIKNLQAVGIELSRSEKRYPWQTKLENLTLPIISVIKNSSLEETKLIHLIKQLLTTLKQVDPTVLAISGYFNPSMLVALFWCRLRNKPVILFSETTESDFERVWWKETIKRLIVKQFKSALVGGKPHKRYLMKLGMPEKAIFVGYDIVGNDTFLPDEIQHLPKPLDRPFFLTVNRFITKKNLPFIIDSYAKYRQQVADKAWDLVLCGDGELRPQIEKQIAELNLQTVVHLPGFLQQEEMLPYFAHAGCFVHGSTTEQWGLVVNEAMAAGLPVLVSNRCGCFEDLIIEGVNGFGFDPENSQQLTSLMLKISAESFDKQKMGNTAFKHIQDFSPDRFANGLMQAVEYATTH